MHDHICFFGKCDVSREHSRCLDTVKDEIAHDKECGLGFRVPLKGSVRVNTKVQYWRLEK